MSEYGCLSIPMQVEHVIHDNSLETHSNNAFYVSLRKKNGIIYLWNTYFFDNQLVTTISVKLYFHNLSTVNVSDALKASDTFVSIHKMFIING